MKHPKNILLAIFVSLSALGFSRDNWLGLYLNGQKIGFSSSVNTPDKIGGQPCVRTDTRTFLSANLMGSLMTIDMASTSYVISGRPVLMLFSMTSSGRTQKLEARFGSKQIDVAILGGGPATKKAIPVPKDGPVVDDPVFALNSLKPGKKSVLYVLDPLTASLVKNTVANKGAEDVIVAGKRSRATRVDIEEVRGSTKVYFDRNGKILVAYGPMGIEMRPMTKAQALAKIGLTKRPDLASASAIKPDRPINNPSQVVQLTLRITGRDLSSIPSGDHQTVKKDGEAWIVTVHPAETVTGVPIEEARTQKPEWTKPSMNMPSDSNLFRKKAREIVGSATTVDAAAAKIHRYVHELMSTNPGIGVIRNAEEILKTKEGVCRDHAILACTLFRAAGIPARLASGLVYQDGFFYYHAWIEAWNGGKWIGVDSTRPERGVTATHLKLAEGNVDDAFVFTFLENSRISVLNINR